MQETKETKRVTDFKPHAVYIGQSKQTENLYRLESKRGDLIKEIADEWSRLVNMDGSLIKDIPGYEYDIAVPQVLFDTLESFGDSSAIKAATAYLESKGFKVTK